MRLLVVTQAVDARSSTLGFFLDWLKEFAASCDGVTVIGLSVGEHALPPNVRVLSMGKERGLGRFGRLRAYRRHLRAELPHADAVFIHMCPEYLVAGWPLFAHAGKPVMLWYAHRAATWRTRLAARMADAIGTVSEGSFPFASPKVRVFGHGIPTDRFRPDAAARVPGRLVAVGRITPIKRLGLLIEALAILRTRGIEAHLDIIGEAVMPGDAEERASLRTLAEARGVAEAVSMPGALPYGAMPAATASASVALNACPNGAPDKAVLEAMACGAPVVVLNRNFAPLLGPDAERCLADADPEAIADRIAALLDAPDPELGARLRAVVEEGHSLKRLIARILASYENR